MLHEATKTAPKRTAAQPAPSGMAPAPAGAAAPELERELRTAEGHKAWLRRLATWAVPVLLVVGIVVWRIRTRPPPQSRYILAPVTRVQVGAQISGRIAKVLVDFNSVVKKGDVMAEIDPTLLGATVEQNRAQLAAADAQEKRARAALTASQAALDRVDKLRSENLASQADVDQARGQRDVAQADLAAARAQIIQTRAQLNYAAANITYARILVPIDGLVVSRNIDPGQTVAASFQAPTLFVIA